MLRFKDMAERISLNSETPTVDMRGYVMTTPVKDIEDYSTISVHYDSSKESVAMKVRLSAGSNSVRRLPVAQYIANVICRVTVGYSRELWF